MPDISEALNKILGHGIAVLLNKVFFSPHSFLTNIMPNSPGIPPSSPLLSQAWLALVCLGLTPSPSCTAPPMSSVTTPAATTSPTGCPPQRPFLWCLWQSGRSQSTSAAVPCVKHLHRQWPSTAKTPAYPPAQMGGGACGSDTLS